jgi:hypothetical protein
MSEHMPRNLPEAFAAALAGDAPPAAWSAPLAALWWLARDPAGPGANDWARAHALVQDAPGPDAAWVHAHLHRIEGDAGNARYWYGRAGRPESRDSLEAERATLIAALAATA